MDNDREDYIAQEEAYVHFTLQEFRHMFRKDPKGIVKDLIDIFDRHECKDLAYRLTKAITTAKVEQ